MAEIVSLAEAVERAIHDGDAVAMEGFTHLIPFAAGHEVIRQRRRDLTLIRMTPDLIYDQLIGAGCARKLIFSWGGNPGVGSLHRFRDAVEHSWPVPLEIEEHSHAGMANRYVAGASGLPFAVLRGYNGTDLYRLEAQRRPRPAPTIKPITCPFTGETLTAVAAIRPDVAVIHAQRPTGRGTSSSGGSPACRRRPCWRRAVGGHGGGDRRRARPPPRGGGPAQLDGELRGAGAGRGAPLLRAGLLGPRQRLLRGLGRHRPGARHVHPVAGRAGFDAVPAGAAYEPQPTGPAGPGEPR